MTVDEPIFSTNAVGVAFVDPEQTGTVHLTVNPEYGAIVLAEAHPIRLRGGGITPEVLNELGSTATALISEYLSNYLSKKSRSQGTLAVEDPSFKNLLEQTISGLDQMLVDTATSGVANTNAYRMDENTEQFVLKSSAKNSLINKITNSLETIVYYPGGIHVAHRGESQLYLVSKRVQKLTQDHIAGGLFSKIGDLGDFIPQIQSNTLAMSTNDELVLFSREASLSSFPPGQLQEWMGEGAPTEQAQRIAEALKTMGKTHGCVVVFSPGWTTGSRDDIASNGMFSLVNLANLEKEQTGNISVIPETAQSNANPRQPQADANGTVSEPTAPSSPASTRLRPTNRNSLSAKPRTSLNAGPRTSLNATPRTSIDAKPRTSLGAKPPTESDARPRTSLGAKPRTSIAAEKRSSSPGAKAQPRTSLAAKKYSSWTNTSDPFEPRRSHRRTIIESEIESITDKVMAQISEKLEDLELQIQTDLNERLSKMRKDILSKSASEVSKAFEKWMAQNLPGLENRLQGQFQEDLNALEMRIGKLMGRGISGLRAELNEVEAAVANAAAHVPAPTAEIVPDTTKDDATDEIEVMEMQNMDFDDDVFSTIPGAIFGGAAGQKKNSPKPPPTGKLKVAQVRKLQPESATLPAPAVYEQPHPEKITQPMEPLAEPYMEDDEEVTAVASSDRMEELVAQHNSAQDAAAAQSRGAGMAIPSETESNSIIPDEDSISYYPFADSRKKKLIAATVIAGMALAAAIFLLFTPWSPVSIPASSPKDTALSDNQTEVPASGKNDIKAAAISHSAQSTTGKESKSNPAAAESPAENANAAAPDDTNDNANANTTDSVPDAAKDNPDAKQKDADISPAAESLAGTEADPGTVKEAASPYAVSPDTSLKNDDLYAKGMELYNMGDSGKDGDKELTSREQQDALISALNHFNAVIEKDGAIQPNIWFVKGRTEYNLTKLEKSKAQRKAYAKSALAAYDTFLDKKNKVSGAKKKTIKRNQKKLKQIIRKGR
ncbi:MAG: hypothetical protein JXR76_07915 [Deltaproteobacteria bacterium]|nr:hypothetical protein [Deltaproteobacteria bacterium]